MAAKDLPRVPINDRDSIAIPMPQTLLHSATQILKKIPARL